MRQQLTIGLDFDNTFTADVECWQELIAVLHKYGHRVVCISGRRDTFEHRRELETALPKGVPVLLSYDKPKRQHAIDSGHAVDIWIDDLPEMIPTSDEIRRMLR